MPGLEPVVQFDLRCTQCPVRHHAVCSALDGSHLHELSDIMAHRHFSAGDEILHQEETSQLFAVIVSGVVKLTRMLPDGREQIVGLLTATDTLGEVNASVSHNSAECVTDVELCCFKRMQFEAVLRELHTPPSPGHQNSLFAVNSNNSSIVLLCLKQEDYPAR